MQLLKYELYKIFKEKSIWITLVLMLGMSYLSLNYPYSSEAEKQMYSEWEGPLTGEKVQQAKVQYAEIVEKERDRMDDEKKVLTDQETMKLWMLQKIMMSENIEKNIEKRLMELESENSRAAEVEKDMIKQIHVNHLVHHSGPGQTIGFVEFGSFMVMGVMLLLGLSPIYSKEYSSGVDHLLFSSKKGKTSLASAKIGAALIYTFIVVVVWESFNLFLNYLIHGFGGWGTPIQLYTLYTKTGYINSPYALTMVEYHMIQLGIHLLAAIAFALLIVLISSLSKNSLVTFFISGFVFMAPVFLENVEWLKTVVAFSYVSVARVQFLFNDFKSIDIFGFPILYPIFACIVMIILLLISVRLTLSVIKRREITS